MSTSWRHFPKSRKPVRDFHRPRYGNPLFANSSGSKVVRRGAAANPNRTARRAQGTGLGDKKRNLLIAAGVVLLGAAWYVFWGSAFRITKTEFVGTTPYTEETLSKALADYEASNALLIFPRNNVLLFSESSAKNAIKDAVYLDDISITKKLPDTVIVTVKEKAMRAVLERGGRLYAVDESGYVLRELTSKEHDMMPDLPPGLNAVSVEGLGAETVTVSGNGTMTDAPSANGAGAANGDGTAPAGTKADAKPDAAAAAKTDKKSDKAAPTAPPAAPEPPPKNGWPLILDHNPEDAIKKPARPGLQAYTPSTLTAILQANARLPDVTGETVRWYTPDESSNSVDATMGTGWHVFLATATPFDVQVDRLSIILKDKIGAKRGELEYVDLRYNEKIFYRLKDQTK